MPKSLSANDRLNLSRLLSGLPVSQFNELITAILPPPGVVSPPSAPQGNRVYELLQWLGSPTGEDYFKDFLEALDMIAPGKFKSSYTPAFSPVKSKSINRLKELRKELENVDLSTWDDVKIWGKKALVTITKNWPEHLDEFECLLEEPIYSFFSRVTVKLKNPGDAIYLLGHRNFRKDYEECKRINQMQNEAEKRIRNQERNNKCKEILAFLDGVIYESEDDY